MWFRSIIVGGNIDELQNQRSSSDDTAATGQEVSSDNVLEDGGFTRGLGANNDLQRRISTKRALLGRITVQFEADPNCHCR